MAQKKKVAEKLRKTAAKSTPRNASPAKRKVGAKRRVDPADKLRDLIRRGNKLREIAKGPAARKLAVQVQKLQKALEGMAEVMRRKRSKAD